MEMALVNRKEVPVKYDWANNFRLLVKKFDGKKADTIRIILKPEDKSAGIESAWRRLCKEEFKKIPHISMHKHNLGTTIWLWMDS